MTFKVNQTAVQDLLRENLESRRAKNAAFSIRAFSKKLKISHSALSEIMSGKRTVGPRLAGRIFDSLNIGPDLRESFAAKDKPVFHRQHLQLRADQYQVIADWFHFAILSLMETKGFRSNANWIARRLGIKEQDVKNAIDRLTRLNLLKKAKSKLHLTGHALSSPDGVANSAVRATHLKYTQLAQRSLEEDEIDKRDFTGMTIAIDPDKLPEARKRLRAFRDQLSAFLESGEKKEVYQLCLQLFPLSKEV